MICLWLKNSVISNSKEKRLEDFNDLKLELQCKVFYVITMMIVLTSQFYWNVNIRCRHIFDFSWSFSNFCLKLRHYPIIMRNLSNMTEEYIRDCFSYVLTLIQRSLLKQLYICQIAAATKWSPIRSRNSFLGCPGKSYSYTRYHNNDWFLSRSLQIW